jgi:hypothetical protein
VLAQRLGVALEDLARLLLAFESFGSSDPFAALRAGSLDRFDDVYSRLAGNPEALRSTIRLPHPEDTSELDAPLREAILEASDVLARRWHGHLERASAGWALLRRLAKAMRHGMPLLPRELVLGPPGAGSLGKGMTDVFDRWVLLLNSEVDRDAAHIDTHYAIADLSDGTLSRAHQAGLDAVALAREISAAHVHRVRSRSRWAMPEEALRLVAPAHARVLRETARD